MQFLQGFLIVSYCFLLSAALSGSQSSTVADTPSDVLAKTNKALSSLAAIQYDYVRELNYPSEAYHHKSSITTYLEFTEGGKPLDFIFQTDEQENAQVYNGSELFELDKKAKSIAINRKPALKDIEHQSFLYNSPLTLRNTLPVIIADASIPKTLADTLINQKRYHIVRFSLKAKTLNNIEGYSELNSPDVKITYQLLIDTVTYLPIEVLQTNSKNRGDYIKTSFVALNSNPKPLAEASWYYSTYLNEYSVERSRQTPTPLAPGTSSPVWRLPLFGSADSAGISLGNNKVTLLEFWYKNCGFCLAAVPGLNELSNKYKGKDFQLLAVNVFDGKSNIEEFLNKTKPMYPTVYNGSAVAQHYGIDGYPSVVLLDKQQRVLYAGGFDAEKLDRLIGATVRVSRK